jgi:hypothetical protein
VIAGVDAIDAAGIGCEVSDRVEAFDRARLQQDDRCQRLADARDAAEQSVARAGLDAHPQALFQDIDLRRQRADDGNVRLHRQGDVGRKPQLVDAVRNELLDLVACRIRDERPTFRNLSLPVKTRPILSWSGNEKWAVTMMSMVLSTVLNT